MIRQKPVTFVCMALNVDVKDWVQMMEKSICLEMKKRPMIVVKHLKFRKLNKYFVNRT